MATLPFQFPATADAETVHASPGDPDSWFSGIKGKHRAVFDVLEPHDTFPFIGPRVFLMTNAATGTPAKDCSVVVILRHEAVPFALGSDLWKKYKLGEATKTNDPDTKAPAVRNIYWHPSPGDFVFPAIGHVPIGIDQLQADGVMYFACGAAMTVLSGVIAQQTHQNQSVVMKELLANVLPGVRVVPSGVWALGRAQEHGCAYCFGY
jgi:hypothetical protein